MIPEIAALICAIAAAFEVFPSFTSFEIPLQIFAPAPALDFASADLPEKTDIVLSAAQQASMDSVATLVGAAGCVAPVAAGATGATGAADAAGALEST